MTTPTPGQPLSEADVSLGNLHTAIMDVLCEDIVRQRPDAFREGDEDGFEGDIIIPTGGTPRSAFAKINVSELAEVILPLVRPHAPVSRPGDGVEIDERTGHPTSYSRTPPAEPVSGPAGEGEREAVARLIRERIGRDFDGECHLTEGEAYRILPLLRPAAPDAGGGWMPIETAPKDGTWIIVSDGSSVEPAVWSDEEDDDGHTGWCAAGYSYGGILYEQHYVLGFSPTHWRPLPAPPALQPGGER